MEIKFKKVRKVKTPHYSTWGSNGIDFYIPDDFKYKQIHLGGGHQINIPSGIKVSMPEGYALLAVNKSGVALKGLQIGACLIDNDYQGEIHLHVHNISGGDIILRPGEKLVQFIPFYIPQVALVEIPFIYGDEETKRGAGGFGSTGLK